MGATKNTCPPLSPLSANWAPFQRGASIHAGLTLSLYPPASCWPQNLPCSKRPLFTVFPTPHLSLSQAPQECEAPSHPRSCPFHAVHNGLPILHPSCEFPEGRTGVSSASPQLGGPPHCLTVQPTLQGDLAPCDEVATQTHATSSKATLQHTHMPAKSRGSPVGGQRRHKLGVCMLGSETSPYPPPPLPATRGTRKVGPGSCRTTCCSLFPLTPGLASSSVS